MQKLVVMFAEGAETASFQGAWQEFMRLAENMPGLLGESVSRSIRMIHGGQDHPIILIHEFFFADRAALDRALASPEGQNAGKFLLAFTRGQVTLLLAEHLQGSPDQIGQKRKK